MEGATVASGSVLLFPPFPAASSSGGAGDAVPHPVANRVSHCVLVFCYTCLATVSLVLVLRSCRWRRPSPDGPAPAKPASLFVSRVFHVSFIFGCAVRATDFLIVSINNELDPPMWVATLDIFPAFLFFVCYLIVLSLWIELYHGKGDHTVKASFRTKIHIFLAVSITIMVAIPVIFYILYIVIHHTEDKNLKSNLTHALQYIVISLYFLMGHGYALYGILIVGRLFCMPLAAPRSPSEKPLLQSPTPSRPTSISSPVLKNVLVRVAAMACLCYVCFCARAAFVLWTLFGYHGSMDIAIKLWWLDLVYYGLTEVLPLCIILLLLRQGPGHNNSSAGNVQGQSSRIKSYPNAMPPFSQLPGSPNWSRQPAQLNL